MSAKKAALEAAVDAPGVREALRRPVIERTVKQRWDEDRQEWVNESKESTVGIGPVGAALVGLGVLGLASSALTAVTEAKRRNGAP